MPIAIVLNFSRTELTKILVEMRKILKRKACFRSNKNGLRGRDFLFLMCVFSREYNTYELK